MKNTIKITLTTLFFCGSLFGAQGTSAAHFSSAEGKNAKQVGGLVGKTAFYVYYNNEAGEIDDARVLDSMAKQAQQQICSDEEKRMLISQLGLQVILLYPNDKDRSVTVISIKECDDKEQSATKGQ